MSAYDWSKIKKVYRFGYLLVVVNVALGYGSYRQHKQSKAEKVNVSDANDLPRGIIYAKRGVKLRIDPDASSAAKVSIPNGEEISIINDTSTVNKGWVQVSYLGNEGWVWGQYIKR